MIFFVWHMPHGVSPHATYHLSRRQVALQEIIVALCTCQNTTFHTQKRLFTHATASLCHAHSHHYTTSATHHALPLHACPSAAHALCTSLHCLSRVLYALAKKREKPALPRFFSPFMSNFAIKCKHVTQHGCHQYTLYVCTNTTYLRQKHC